MDLSLVILKELARCRETGLKVYLIQRCRLLPKVLEDLMGSFILKLALNRTIFRYVVERCPNAAQIIICQILSPRGIACSA
ncbi:MAG TPA: hypothetical protein VMT12_14105 [Syntrophales bacterium]|nr:hypothetical protein [Syntrophales bacterium]